MRSSGCCVATTFRVDCQQETPHLASLGARPIERREFTNLLARLIVNADAPNWWPQGPLSNDDE